MVWEIAGSVPGYRINNFIPPLDFSDWGLTIDVPQELLVLALQTPRPDYLDEICLQKSMEALISSRLGLEKNVGKHFTFYEDTVLLEQCKVGGDECYLYLDTFDKRALVDNPDSLDGWVRYYNHNVEKMNQAVCLLSLWTYWYSILECIFRKK